jgi:hypothetical protein
MLTRFDRWHSRAPSETLVEDDAFQQATALTAVP